MAYTTIDDPTIFFNTVTYTGDLQDSDGTGHTQSITGVGFQPDWVWHKGRSGARTHMIVDRVRTVSSYNWLVSSGSGAELTTNTNGAISSIDSDGITVQNGNDSSSKSNNAGKNGETWVFWNWKAGGSASSNSNGSITSSVSANTTAGFSIVKYTGTGSNATIGHGLGVEPSMIIIKNLTAGRDWLVYHKKLGNTNGIYLDLTLASTSSSGFFNNTSPTSSVFSVGTDTDANDSSDDTIAYCFAEKKGYSKFGQYEGNANADGTFVYTGFLPAFVMVKNIDATENWIIFDNKRPGRNLTDALLKPNLSNAESTTGVKFDLLSNGFKARVSDAEGNSGNTFIYMAFAENPFVNSNGVPTNAR